MKENKKIKLKSIYWFIIMIIYLECVYKHFVFGNLFTIDTLRIIFNSISIALCFYLLSNLFSEKVNRIISVLLSSFIFLLFGAQIIYYAFYDSIFSVFSLTNGTGQVLGFASAIADMMVRNYIPLLFVFIPSILYIIFSKKMFSYKRLSIKKIIIVLITMLVSYIGTRGIILLNNSGMYSLKRLYTEAHAPILTVNKLGLMTMERLDLKRFMFGFEEKLWINNDVEKIPEVLIPEVKYNVMEIDFESLIASESDETIKSMHTYFNNVTPTSENEYTGMFEGKNLIYITAEGFDTIAIDEIVTPTLYKLANNGFVFNNFYQPLFTVSTSDGEYMNMLSYLPKEGVWSTYRSSNIYVPFALGNVFNKLGYVSNAWHNHSYKYYDRHLSHPNMGFNYVGCGNGLEKLMNCNQWPESDIELVDVTVPSFINSDKFLTYYMTVSGHLNYTFTGNSMSYKNKSIVSDLPYSSNVQAYIAANVEFDRALEKLLASLTEAGKLDDTVIVISPDHYPYGLKIDELNEASEINRNDKFDLYKTTLIIYNSEMEKVEVNKIASSIDILPTVYNLFGVEFDSRLLMGRDLLSEGEGLVMLSDRSWLTESGNYNSISGVFTPSKDDVSDEYVSIKNEEVYQKFTISSLILSDIRGVYLDYFRKIGL